MKHINTLFLVLLTLSISAQEVLCSRSAVLENNGYAITGTASLEKISENNIQLKLSSDYTTAAGPDVRIYLSKLESFNISSTVEVVNLATNGDFSGAKTFSVPNDIVLEDYPFVLFHCLRFNASWAKGTWSGVEGLCEPTAIFSDVEKEDGTIYPNPTQGGINFGELVGGINVYNIEGVRVLTAENVATLDLSNLPNNTYVVMFNGKRQLVTVQK